MVQPIHPSTSESRHPVESIASEFAESVRGGQDDSIDSVIESNPQLESELRELLPVVQRLEKARKAQSQRPAGLASLGASRPDRLGDYEIVRQIGRGGMGVVFEAVQQSLGRRVALKVLPKSLLSDDNQLKRFEREARTAGSLHHTNIVPVFGVGEDQGFHYYVMPRIQGHGLDRLLGDDAEKLTPEQVASLGQQAASALAYAHQQKVLHRDIKPANLIVNDELELWVTDFGVAKAIESEAVTRTGDVLGTLRYMAPEQIVGDSDVRSDVYSLGVTLYELLAGRPAMDDASIREAIVSRRPAPAPPRLRQLNPDVPRDLETILHTAMSIDVSTRYQSAEAFANDLQHFLDGEPISVRRLSLIESGARWAKKNPAIAALSTLSMLLLAGVAILSTIGFVHVQRALDREENSRLRAEATASLATGALDQIFRRFTGTSDAMAGTSEFSSTPALSDEAAELLEDLLHYYDELAARGHADPKLRQSVVDARYAIGDIHFKLGHYDRAIEAFALSLTESLENADATTEQQRLREARTHNRIGLAHRMEGENASADTEHQLSLDILVPESDKIDIAAADAPLERAWMYELARTHFLKAVRLRPGMGPTAMPPLEAITERDDRNGQFRPQRPPPGSRATAEADESHLQTAIAILRQLHDADPNHVGYSLALAASLRQLESGPRTVPGRQASSSESIQFLQDLHQANRDDETVRFELAETLAELDAFNVVLGPAQLRDKIDLLKEALTHLEWLSAANPNVPKYTNAVVHTHFKLALLLERLAEITDGGQGRELEQQAGVSLRAATDLYGVLLRKHPDSLGYQAWHALFLYHQGDNALKNGLFEQAEESLQQSIVEWKQLIKNHPQEEISWHALPRAYESLSHTQHRLGRHDEAMKSMDQSEMSRFYRDMNR